MQKELKNYLFLSLGSLVLALGVSLFLLPNKIATGGAPGMAILLHYLTGLSTGTLMFLINVPLLLIGIRFLGKAFAIRTVVTIILSSIFVDVCIEVFAFEALAKDTLLATLFGGAVIGAGVGLILQGSASAGGSTIIARIISSQTEIKPGQIILFIDFLIIVASIFIFDDVEKALWSLLSIYVTSKCIDTMLSGAPSKKVVHIASNEVQTLSAKIVEHLGKEGTILSGQGIFEGENKTMIFVVVEVRKLKLLREIVSESDPKAFMVIMEASEMQGRGH